MRVDRALMKSLMVIVLGFATACTNVAVTDESLELTGRVTRVVDGDTVELTAADKSLVRIRLAQIDAPEMSQPYGERAAAALSALTFGKRVRIEVVDIDKYGRTIGEIYVKGLHVNSEMVRLGHAWAYTRYVSSLDIIDLEDEARSYDRGLWKLPPADRIAPWVWRHRGRGTRKPTGEADTVCGEKRTCKEMVSCAEARFYLTECGVGGLDGDRDGVPCEAKCVGY